MNSKEIDAYKEFFERNWRLIYTPGPTMVPPRVLQAMSKQIINPDLDPDFSDWFLETSQKTAEVIKTKNEVLILPGEGMLALDAALISVVKPKPDVGITNVKEIKSSRNPFPQKFFRARIYARGTPKRRSITIAEIARRNDKPRYFWISTQFVSPIRGLAKTSA